MTVEEIISAVRWCYDEEKLTDAGFSSASAGDMSLMDNIIKAKIGDAVRWICLYAPAELLGGSDETTSSGGQQVPYETGILVDMPKSGTLTPTAITGTTGGYIALPADFIKLARVRVSDWHRAVKEPLSEDSDEYLQLYDTNGAAATADRPQAAIIDKSEKILEVWPMGTNKTVEYTYVAATEGETFVTGAGTAQDPYVTHYALPPRVRTAFIYYLAFLVLSAYEDSRSARMLEIAKMNLGK